MGRFLVVSGPTAYERLPKQTLPTADVALNGRAGADRVSSVGQ